MNTETRHYETIITETLPTETPKKSAAPARSRRAQGIIMTLLSAICFGLMPILAKKLYAAGAEPLQLTFYRFLMSLPILALFSALQKKPVSSIRRRDFRSFMSLGVGIGMTAILLFASYQYIGAGLATTLHYVYPILVILISAMVYRRRPRTIQILCAVLSLLGILCFYTPGEKQAWQGLILALLSGLTYAIYVVGLEHSAARHFAMPLVCFWVQLPTVICLSIFLLVQGKLPMPFDAANWLLMQLFSFLTSVLGIMFLQTGILLVGSSTAALLSTFEPLTSLVLGVLVLGETFSWKAGLGIFLILSAVFLIFRDQSRQSRASA